MGRTKLVIDAHAAQQAKLIDEDTGVDLIKNLAVLGLQVSLGGTGYPHVELVVLIDEIEIWDANFVTQEIVRVRERKQPCPSTT